MTRDFRRCDHVRTAPQLVRFGHLPLEIFHRTLVASGFDTQMAGFPAEG
jgi:hypothetical protein